MAVEIVTVVLPFDPAVKVTLPVENVTDGIDDPEGDTDAASVTCPAKPVLFKDIVAVVEDPADTPRLVGFALTV